MKTTYHEVSRNPNRSVPYQAPSVGIHVIGIVVFDGFSMLPAVEVADVFDKANQVLAGGHDDAPRYRTVFASSHGGCVSSSARIDVLTQPAEQFRSARAVFVAIYDGLAPAAQLHVRKVSLECGAGAGNEAVLAHTVAQMASGLDFTSAT